MSKCNSVAFEIVIAPGPVSPKAAPKELLERLNPSKDPLTLEKLAMRLQRAEEKRLSLLSKQGETNFKLRQNRARREAKALQPLIEAQELGQKLQEEAILAKEKREAL